MADSCHSILTSTAGMLTYLKPSRGTDLHWDRAGAEPQSGGTPEWDEDVHSKADILTGGLRHILNAPEFQNLDVLKTTLPDEGEAARAQVETRASVSTAHALQWGGIRWLQAEGKDLRHEPAHARLFRMTGRWSHLATHFP